MSFYGKNSNISSDYVNVYNSWCHFENDSYFTKVQYTKLLDGGGMLSGLANLTTSDTWRTMGTFNFYSPSSTSSTPIQISCIAAGAFPTFTNNFYSLETNTYGTHTDVLGYPRFEDYDIQYLTMTPFTASNGKQGLSIAGQNGEGTHSFTSRDGAVPKFICFALQGGGGGGGSSGGNPGNRAAGDGAGGGGGGFIAGILKLDFTRYDYRIYVGYGGMKGYGCSADITDLTAPYYEYDGGTGGPTKIEVVDKNTGTAMNVVVAYGGKGGDHQDRNKTDVVQIDGGGTWYNSSFVSRVVTCTGGKGGAVYSNGNATGCSSVTVKATARSDYQTFGEGSGLSFYHYWPATSGGAQGENKAPGGGGGSVLANGPAGGGFMSNGKDGTKGAGGSGARYTLVPLAPLSKLGGQGGDGCVYLWY